MIGDEIRVIVVDGPSEAGSPYLRAREKIIRPKDRFFKKLMGILDPKICSCSLKSVFPGHSMKILDDGFPSQRYGHPGWSEWTMRDLDETIFGNAVIYGIENSLPVSATVSLEEVQARLVDLA